MEGINDYFTTNSNKNEEPKNISICFAVIIHFLLAPEDELENYIFEASKLATEKLVTKFLNPAIEKKSYYSFTNH